MKSLILAALTLSSIYSHAEIVQSGPILELINWTREMALNGGVQKDAGGVVTITRVKTGKVVGTEAVCTLKITVNEGKANGAFTVGYELASGGFSKMVVISQDAVVMDNSIVHEFVDADEREVQIVNTVRGGNAGDNVVSGIHIRRENGDILRASAEGTDENINLLCDF